jgi:hypothetical protein
MSLSYTHLLIPRSPEYRPAPEALAAFSQGIVDLGNIASPFSISFSPVTKGDPNFREVRNTFTGETIRLRMPSRKIGQPQTISAITQIVECVSSQREYHLSISSQGVPVVPPCEVGYVENDAWKPMREACHQEIRCCVRDHVVRLSMVNSEEELHQPLDLSKWQPIFDEDCSVDDHEGIFVHPQQAEFRIPNAGCSTFWIEFRYGKFVFPLLKNGGLNLLNDAIVTLARKTFSKEFVQACLWG